jgi:hypothetical protein
MSVALTMAASNPPEVGRGRLDVAGASPDGSIGWRSGRSHFEIQAAGSGRHVSNGVERFALFWRSAWLVDSIWTDGRGYLMTGLPTNSGVAPISAEKCLHLHRAQV